MNILYKELLSSVSDWIWIVNSNGVYTYCSENVYEYLGYHAHEVVGKTPFEFMSEAEALRVGKLFGTFVLEKAKIEKLDNIHLHKSGKEVIVETTGIPIFDDNEVLIGYQGFDRDVTEQRKLADSIEKQNAVFEVLFEQSPSGALILHNNIFTDRKSVV